MKNYIQKIGAALVLLLFLLSIVPVALADIGVGVDLGVDAEVSGNSVEASIDSEAKVNDEDKSGSDEDIDEDEEKIRLRKLNQLRKADLQEEIRKKIAVKEAFEKKEDFKNRAEKRLLEAKVNLIKAREGYSKVKERYHLAVEEHREQREKIRNLDKESKKCRNGGSEECEKVRLELKLGVVTHLEKTINVVERALEKLKSRVEDIKDLSNEEKENAFELIVSLEEELDAVKEKVESFDENTTREEIRDAISELKEIAQKARKLQRRIVSLLINAKLGVLVEKHAEFRNGMELRINTLVELGVDVSELEEILAEFDQKVEELEKDYEAAQNKWKDSNNERFDLFVKEVREAQHQVRKDLQETKKIVREFIKKYKELKNPEETDDPDEDEKESDETDDEDDEADESGDNESEDLEDETDEEDLSQESQVKVSGDVELSSEAQTALDSLAASLSSDVELSLKAEKKGGETKIESESEGSLTLEQQGLWTTLQNLVKSLMEEAEGDELKIEISIENAG